MAITTNIVIPERNLAANNITAKLYAGANASKRFRIYQKNTITNEFNIVIYEGTIYSLTDTYSEIDISSLFSELRYVAGISLYRIFLLTDEGEEADSSDFAVYGGGISKLLIRKLNGSSIFDTKLKVSNTNFFLTTRTNDRIITIPEDELMPLYFYRKGMKFKIMVDRELVLNEDYTEETDEYLEYQDFSQWRTILANTKNKLASVFDIVTDTSYSCSLIITEAESRTDYYLKFRNSWGVWDKIALRGKMNYAPEFSEVKKVAEYDAVVSDFVDRNQRKTGTHIFTTTTGYKTEDQRLLLLDLIFSKTVILIAHGTEYEVNLTADNSIFGSSSPEPIDVSLRIQLIDTDSNFSPLTITNAYETLVTTTLENITTGDADIIL